jgi:hypothetical protein
VVEAQQGALLRRKGGDRRAHGLCKHGQVARAQVLELGIAARCHEHLIIEWLLATQRGAKIECDPHGGDTDHVSSTRTDANRWSQ